MTRLFLFQPGFVPRILDGTKHQTIRRQARCSPGDTISIRYWDGVPRRRWSRQVVILETVCTVVRHVVIFCGDGNHVRVDGRVLSADEQLEFAVADGFDSRSDMFNWFRARYGSPFIGEMIEWEPPEVSP